jgi:hypothetical protein
VTVRAFNGTSDALVLSIGALATLSVGPSTFATLLKPMETGTDKGIVSMGPSFTTASSSFSQGKMTLWQGNSTSAGIHVGLNSTTDTLQATVLMGSADGWVIVVVTKASGTTAPRIHKRVLSSATTSRANTGTAVANVAFSGTDTIVFGKSEYINWYTMRLATAGFWNVAMSDAQVDALWTNLRTSDWYGHAAGAPVALWDFNQTGNGTPVQDLMGGGANQTAIAGTSVVSGDDPPGWVFGTGGPADMTAKPALPGYFSPQVRQEAWF